ncbi:MAG: hypothetical protein ACLGI3_16860 [Actinomycetes bacterium]
MSAHGPLIPDRRTAQLAGIGFVCLGAFLLFDAYEARGRSRPFARRFLPG